MGGEGGGIVGGVVVEGGGAEEIPWLQGADGEAALGHQYPSGEEQPQTTAEAVGAVDLCAGGELLHRTAGPRQDIPDQCLGTCLKQGAAEEQIPLVRRERDRHGGQLLSKTVSFETALL